MAIETRKVNWILDADIQSFFDRVSHDWLVRFVMLKHAFGMTSTGSPTRGCCA